MNISSAKDPREDKNKSRLLYGSLLFASFNPFKGELCITNLHVLALIKEPLYTLLFFLPSRPKKRNVIGQRMPPTITSRK